VVGEGIEDAQQLATARELGFCTGQGYLFGRPVDAPAIQDWLDAGAAMALA